MTIMPEGDAVRNAVKWISEMLKDDAGKSISALIQQACLKFDLTPLEAEFLTAFYKKDV